MTLTTWGAWERRHPETTVVELDPRYGARWGYTYEPGLADRARAGVAFPVWQRDGRLERDAEIYGLRLGDATKAYPVAALHRERLVLDRLGDTSLVLIVEATGGGVRAFHTGGRRFRLAEHPEALEDGAKKIWRVTEDALEPPASSRLEPLPRIPGHHAFWFGWYGFFPHTEVYATDTGSP